MAKVSAAFGRGAMPSHLGNYGGPSPNLSHCGGRGIVLALLLLTLTPAVAFGQASAPGSAPASPGQAAATSPSPAQAPGAAQPPTAASAPAAAAGSAQPASQAAAPQGAAAQPAASGPAVRGLPTPVGANLPPPQPEGL